MQVVEDSGGGVMAVGVVEEAGVEEGEVGVDPQGVEAGVDVAGARREAMKEVVVRVPTSLSRQTDT